MSLWPAQSSSADGVTLSRKNLHADLVLLGADLDHTAALDLGEVPIEMVWIDGAVVKS